MRIDPRAWTAVLVTVLALWLAVPREDGFLIPERRRGPLAWLRHRLGRPGRDAQEERDAENFLRKVREPDPPVYTIKQSDLPSASRRFNTILLTQGEGHPPWEPVPERESQDDPRERPQEIAQEQPQERSQKPLPELRAWRPGDPGRAPTGVIQKIMPEVDRQVRPYLDSLPGYRDEPRQ